MSQWGLQGSLRAHLRELSHLLLEERLQEDRTGSVEPDRGSSVSSSYYSSAEKNPQKRILSQTIDFDHDYKHRHKRNSRFGDVSLRLVDDVASKHHSPESSSLLGLENDDFSLEGESANQEKSASSSQNIHEDPTKGGQSPKQDLGLEDPTEKYSTRSPLKKQERKSSINRHSTTPEELELTPKLTSSLLKLCLFPSSTVSSRDVFRILPTFFSAEMSAKIREAVLSNDVSIGLGMVTSILKDRDLLAANSGKDEFYDFCCQYLCTEDLMAVEMAIYT
ncbi:uncharacterized protein LALA0_S06e08196g [Lachancea lanzarotensis]|uniref:LALA0S06e08196g1_1 n=1 Tax=Lachancea lanzarotensis TaxID=1245769 RepID=A0A0C7MZ14_9SACH|nr:uncharacterized protein LALA0_S06e08196g [Lachancea lanzarotensis]CEP62976.1 LALA0S06e08196g1_1 [Lachancea lanzarotensis]